MAFRISNLVPAILSALPMSLAFALSALANDSTAELENGGIVLTRSDGVRLISEDLYLSMEEVRVDYVFENRKDTPLETIVAFPMPDLPGGIDRMVALPEGAGDNFLDFSTTIDGVPVEPQLDQRAVAAGIDVTDDLLAQGVPLNPFGEATGNAVKALPDDVKADWVTRGILAQAVFGGPGKEKTVQFAQWTLRSAYWWPAIFPAKAQVRVSHRYRPSVGATASIYLVHDGEPNEYFPEYQSKYCIDDGFLSALIKADQRDEHLAEHRLDYVLTSGGNWANGTIGRFHLTVDKGDVKNLASFCGTDVKKTGPTTFEMNVENYYPEKDIHILFTSPLNN